MRHMDSKHSTNNERFKCDLCDKDFQTKGGLKLHLDTVHSEMTFQCHLCPKIFRSASGLKTHIKEVHEGMRRSSEKIMCTECGKVVTRQTLFVHMRSQHGKERLRCDQCDSDTIFRDKKMLDQHIKNFHINFVVCPHCGDEVKAISLKSHILSKHTANEDMPYHCQFCKKGFKSKQRLSNHENIHTGEKKHACRFCDRMFIDSSNRNKHSRESHPKEHQAYMKNLKNRTE